MGLPPQTPWAAAPTTEYGPGGSLSTLSPRYTGLLVDATGLVTFWDGRPGGGAAATVGLAHTAGIPVWNDTSRPIGFDERAGPAQGQAFSSDHGI